MTMRIFCDACEADITETGKMPAFRLHLTCEALPHTTNSIYAVRVNPPLKDDCWFCGMACLRLWLVRQGNKREERGM